MRLSSLAAGGLPRLEEPCSRAAELPFAVLWLFSKFRTFGPVVRDDADNRGRLQNLLLSVLEQLPKSFQEAHIRLRTVVVPPPLETPSGLQRAAGPDAPKVSHTGIGGTPSYQGQDLRRDLPLIAPHRSI